MGEIARSWSFLVILLIGRAGHAYRIFMVAPIPSGSHAILAHACVKVLLEAGHEVTYVTAMPDRIESHPQLAVVDVSSQAEYYPISLINLTTVFEAGSEIPSTAGDLNMTTSYCVRIMKHKAVQRALSDGKQYDVLIAEWMFSEIYAGVSALLGCPLIWLSTMEPHSAILSLVDEIPNPTYIDVYNVRYVEPYFFLHRIRQLFVHIYYHVYKAYHIYFRETKEYIDLFDPMMKKLGKKLPPYKDLRYNASLVLSNSHVSLGQAIRLPQNFIPIGGYHIDPVVKALPKDLKKIMDISKNGVIYFCMGSMLKSKDFPMKLKHELLKLFSTMKQTVLWKFEEDIPNLPNNVHILKWAPQQGILDHPNCILFITHGGMLSLIESIYSAVPVIGIPVFGDQFGNMLRAEQKGFVKKIDLSHNLAYDLQIAVQEVLGNPRYREKVKELSFSYHKRPVQPRRELLHWVEYVVQTRGAPLLKSPSFNIPFYQKYYLDLAVLSAIIILALCKLWKWIKLYSKWWVSENAMSSRIKKKL